MKKKLLMLIILLQINILLIFNTLSIYAHSSYFEIEYDVCEGKIDEEGEDELWYYLDEWYDEEGGYLMQSHLSHTIQTIKYYFSEESNDGLEYTWTSDINLALAEYIKGAYVNSMKKWNNVYFYRYKTNGEYEKKKIINIVEGTENDHNLIIYPSNIIDAVANTYQYDANSYELVGNRFDKSGHRHYNEWKMIIKIDFFYSSDINYNEQNNVELFRERTGAHELGHVLGLGDLDAFCDNGTAYHHEETLMGYGYNTRQTEITYRDLAGVAITRGFHTDSDHKWLYDNVNSSNESYKLICSICNGVKRVSNLSDYTYLPYKSCNNNHELSSNNMMAVGCYGNKDYYKCKYCKYVAPFSSNKEQNYQYVDYGSSITHKVNNQVTGLLYNFYEEHSHTVSHEWINLSSHKSYCICGDAKQMGHAVSSDDFNSGAQIVRCLICGGNASIGIIQNGIVVKVSENGSFILNNGLTVLVREDIDAYKNGILVFRNIDEESI